LWNWAGSFTIICMRILALGDIHGCSRALDAILNSVRPHPDDQIIALGDYVDRGPDSMGVLERLIALRRTHKLVALRGNHEQMMLDARAGNLGANFWFEWGGHDTLVSYTPWGEDGSLAEVPPHHWDFMEKDCVNWYETDTHIFVHAIVDPDLPLDQQPLAKLHWEPLHSSQKPHLSGKIVICGHTAQRSGKPLNLGHTICIDTWVYGEGCLTCLDVTTGKYWQANQLGQTRQGWIDEHG
jgi:serine/threonine protein phosphatase 1